MRESQSTVASFGFGRPLNRGISQVGLCRSVVFLQVVARNLEKEEEAEADEE
jgi:hypothetical protein